MTEEGDFYTVEQAAKILKLTSGRIRQMLRSGALEGERDEAGRWRIPAHAVHDRPRTVRVERTSPTETTSESRESPEKLAELESEVRVPQISTRPPAGPPVAYGEGGKHSAGGP